MSDKWREQMNIKNKKQMFEKAGEVGA